MERLARLSFGLGCFLLLACLLTFIHYAITRQGNLVLSFYLFIFSIFFVQFPNVLKRWLGK